MTPKTRESKKNNNDIHFKVIKTMIGKLFQKTISICEASRKLGLKQNIEDCIF